MQEWDTERQEIIRMTSYQPLNTHMLCHLSLGTTAADSLDTAWGGCHFLMRSQRSLTSCWKMLPLGFVTIPLVGECAFMKCECLCFRMEKLSQEGPWSTKALEVQFGKQHFPSGPSSETLGLASIEECIDQSGPVKHTWTSELPKPWDTIMHFLNLLRLGWFIAHQWMTSTGPPPSATLRCCLYWYLVNMQKDQKLLALSICFI